MTEFVALRYILVERFHVSVDFVDVGRIRPNNVGKILRGRKTLNVIAVRIDLYSFVSERHVRIFFLEAVGKTCDHGSFVLVRAGNAYRNSRFDVLVGDFNVNRTAAAVVAFTLARSCDCDR